jgi:NadR type nicotinamide-nucleotide adenylyltransferase
VVRAAVRRIVLTGPECTGKSTLAAALAAELGAPLVAESARAYAEEVKRALTVDDVEPIARRHVRAEDETLTLRPPTIVLDTDLLSTVVYGRHYYGLRSEWIETEARARLGSIYLLCHPDVPWVRDGIRDRPGDRSEMLEEFRGVLAEFGANVVEIRGLGEARFDAVRAAATA